jgi:hypothetical protein
VEITGRRGMLTVSQHDSAFGMAYFPRGFYLEGHTINSSIANPNRIL